MLDELIGRIDVVAGFPAEISNAPTAVFDPNRLSFLADLSKNILLNPSARLMPDVMSFAYWIRAANLIRLKKTSKNINGRFGLGLAVHIAPSNVDINFAYSLAFGLLSGNASIVRLPTRNSETIEVIVGCINKLLNVSYTTLRESILLVRFPHDDEINKILFSLADLRVIWGGDKTIQDMRSFRAPPRSREIAFADRFSFCILSPDAILGLSGNLLKKFCINLYNDIYFMDQAACSSPQLIVWVGDANSIESAKDYFWPIFCEYVKTRYRPEPKKIFDKYVWACRQTFSNLNINRVVLDDNLLYRLEMFDVDIHQEERRGYFGTLHEVSVGSLDEVAKIVSTRYQTLTYFGFSKLDLFSFVSSNRLRGVDRAVPVGRALEMGLIWDGYDVIQSMTRVLDFH